MRHYLILLFRHYHLVQSYVNEICLHINPLNAELNPICNLLELLGGATIVVVSRLRVNGFSTKLLMNIQHYARLPYCFLQPATKHPFT